MLEPERTITLHLTRFSDARLHSCLGFSKWHGSTQRERRKVIIEGNTGKVKCVGVDYLLEDDSTT
jgi:hypothetical protein